MRAVLAVLTSLAVVAGLAKAAISPAHAVTPSPEAGADLAARWCAGCHVVSTSGAGADSAPAFAAIANRHTVTEIRQFLVKPHAQPMRGFALSPREADDVAAYIETLQQRAEGR